MPEAQRCQILDVRCWMLDADVRRYMAQAVDAGCLESNETLEMLNQDVGL